MAPLVRTGGSRHTGLAAPPHRNIQSDNISAQATFEREYLPLLQIRDAFPKMIIARTKHPKYTYEGVEVCDIVEWLLDES